MVVGKAKHTKRENFEVTPEQQSAIETLQNLIEAPSKKDALLFAVQVTLQLAKEARKGNQLFIGDPTRPDERMRIVLVGLEKAIPTWTYLVEHAHPWKKQLFVKGRKLAASAVWTTMIANQLSEEEAAHNWDLPVDAVQEIIRYCESNRVLLEMEAEEELRRLEEQGVRVEITPR